MDNLYVISLKEDNSFCKIGVTSNIERRLSEISNNTGKDLVLLNSIETDDAYFYEKQLHLKYDHCNTHGEWFQLDASDVEYLAMMSKESLLKLKTLVPIGAGFIQRRKDMYFSANEIINIHNEKHENAHVQLNNYKNSNKTLEYIELLQAEGIEKPIISSRGKNGGTWMHPKLFIDFAMWVSVEFKSIVIDYVLDGLIMSRTEAGDYYNEMCAQILKTHIDYYGKKPNPSLYISEARMIRELLGFNKKDRNEMTEKELSNVTSMQKLNAILLEDNLPKDKRVDRLTLQSRLLNK